MGVELMRMGTGWVRVVLTVGAFAAATLMGCGAIGGRNTLPSTVTLELPDGTTVEVEQGGGAASLANTTWQFYRTNSSGQSLAFAQITFGAEGNLERFDNNTFASAIFGDTILFDGQIHATTQQGLSYSAATFGAETSDATGFTFEGQLAAFAAGIPAATATATAVASYDPDDPDTVIGTFNFSSHVTIASIPGGDVEDEFPFVGRRVNDQE